MLMHDFQTNWVATCTKNYTNNNINIRASPCSFRGNQLRPNLSDIVGVVDLGYLTKSGCSTAWFYLLYY